MSDNLPAPRGRLLVVDDESALVCALLSTLRDEGYVVSGATTPTDALELLRRDRFDAILTDLHLPEMDGIALLRAALDIDPTLMGIMMTGHGTIDTAVDAMKAGAVDYVLKPFKLKSVLAVLSRALAVRRLRQENEALHRRLERRTRELEAVNHELEAFSYSVSHDLRAPLQAIEGYTEAMREEYESGTRETIDHYGVRIKKNVQRMRSMIDDLLKLARAVRTELKRTQVDLGEISREILTKLQSQSPARKLECAVADNLLVEGDAGLLQIAMENLLSNAWKYTGRRDPARIEVGIHRSPAETVFFVKDNGVGFDPTQSDRLFVPFQRLHSDRDFEGTGVGLATVQRIVRRHGGRIWPESAPDQGATFFFTLPACLDLEGNGGAAPAACE